VGATRAGAPIESRPEDLTISVPSTIPTTTAGSPRVSSAPGSSQEPAGILLVRVLVLAFLVGGLARTWADPDLWGHVRFGADILSEGLHSLDTYSFTSDIPWVNHEWLAEAVMYLAWAAFGGAGLVGLKLLVVVGTFLLVVSALRKDHLPPVTRDLVVSVLLLGLWARVFVVRPQLFSIVLFAGLLSSIRAAERGRLRSLWLVPLTFVIWVNTHGGWIVGMGALLVWTGAVLAGLVPGVSRRAALIAAAGGIAATLLNPYGYGLWTFLGETVSLDRPNINDWKPLVDSGAQVVIPWLLTATLAIVAVFRGGRRIPISHVVIAVGLAVASIRVNRLDVFFTLSTVMLLAPYVAEPLSRPLPWRVWTLPTVAAAGVLLLVLTLAGWSQRAQLACVRLDGPWMPERESGAFITANHLQGRLLSWFDWGQYAIWHFAPGLRVSMDGRRETVYSTKFVAEHVQLYFEPEKAVGLLARLHPDYAWLPAGLPLVAALDRAGWSRLYTGPESVVFAREPSSSMVTGVTSTPPCFPGP
jgi:hypothetical protein